MFKETDGNKLEYKKKKKLVNHKFIQGIPKYQQDVNFISWEQNSNLSFIYTKKGNLTKDIRVSMAQETRQRDGRPCTGRRLGQGGEGGREQGASHSRVHHFPLHCPHVWGHRVWGCHTMPLLLTGIFVNTAEWHELCSLHLGGYPLWDIGEEAQTGKHHKAQEEAGAL